MVHKFEIPQNRLNKLDKERLLSDLDYAFDNILPEETEKANVYRNIYGYFNSMFFYEFERMRSYYCENHKKQFRFISNRNDSIMTEVLAVNIVA